MLKIKDDQVVKNQKSFPVKTGNSNLEIQPLKRLRGSPYEQADPKFSLQSSSESTATHQHIYYDIFKMLHRK